MASLAGAIRMGRAFIELFADDSKLQQGLKNASKDLKSWGLSIGKIGASLSGLGASITAPITLAVKQWADASAALANMRDRTGASVEALSALGFAAGQTGTDLDAVEVAIKKMQKTITEAALGSDEAVTALGALGITVDELRGMKPEDQFARIARGIASIKDPTFRAGEALKIFGRSGTTVLPLIENFDSLIDTAQEFGLIAKGETVDAGRALAQSMNLLSKVTASVTRAIGAAVGPAWTQWNIAAARVGVTIKDLIATHKPLVTQIYTVGLVATVAGTAIVGLGTAFYVAGVAVAGFGTVLAGIASVASAILSPLGLIVAGLGGLSYWFLTSTESGKALVKTLGSGFRELLTTATDAFKGISDALTAGEIKLAGRILWAALQVAWIEGTQAVKAIFWSWVSSITESFYSVKDTVAHTAVDLWAGIQTIWAKGMAVVANVWYDGFDPLFIWIGERIDRALKQLAGFFKTVGKGTYSALQYINTTVKGAIEAGKNIGKAALQAGVDAIIHKAFTPEAGAGAPAPGDQAKAANDRAAALQKQLDAIEIQRTETQSKLDQQSDAAKKEREAGGGTGPTQEQAFELLKSQIALAGLEAEAARKRAALKEVGLGKGGPGAPGAEDTGLPPEVDKALEKTKAKIDVAGSLSGQALFGLGAGSSVREENKQQLNEQKKATKHLEKIEKNTKEARNVFS